MIAVPISAWVGSDEPAVLAHGLADVLAAGLAGEQAVVDFRQTSGFDELLQAPAGTIRIVSLQRYLGGDERSWAGIERRLHDELAALAETGDPVLVETVFRCVPDRGSNAGQALLERIRRLNLLITELSRELGVFVVDFDRVLADIGGVVLATDYRLRGQAAAEVAGQELALAVATNALDTVLPFDAQERVRTFVESRRNTAVRPSLELSPAGLVTMGKGRHRRRVSVNTDAVQENHVSWLISQVLKRRMGLDEAYQRLTMAVRRRGVRESLGLLFSGFVRSTVRRKTS
ncbi:MAG: hypothetical protein AB7E24_03540 [Novosphingobium sp.]